MEVQIRVLGPLEVCVGGAVIELPAGRPRRLLACLALRANAVVAADVLVESLWDGRPPRTAAKALHVHVSQLRRVLPDGYLLTRPGGYSLVAAGDELDALAFERVVAAGRDAPRGGDKQVYRPASRRGWRWASTPTCSRRWDGRSRTTRTGSD